MPSRIPLVIISDRQNTRQNTYQNICVDHARSWGNDLVIIGDFPVHSPVQSPAQSSVHSPAQPPVQSSVQPSDQYAKEYETFESAYVHLSKKKQEFELFCFKRWFLLAAYMHRNKVERAYHIDSDVIYSTRTNEMEAVYNPQGKEAALAIPSQDYDERRWLASAHVSMWTLPILSEFCRFVTSTYTSSDKLELLTQNIEYHRHHAIRYNGISDMTLLYLFYHQHQGRIVNLLLAQQGRACDYGIAARDNFFRGEYRKGYTYYKVIDKDYFATLPAHYQKSFNKQKWIESKKLCFADGLVYGILSKTKTKAKALSKAQTKAQSSASASASARIRFDVLHCAERDKVLMHHIVQSMHASKTTSETTNKATNKANSKTHPSSPIASSKGSPITSSVTAAATASPTLSFRKSLLIQLWRYIWLLGFCLRKMIITTGVWSLRTFPFLRKVKKLILHLLKKA